MAHRISIRNGKAEFAYTGENPWHNLGERSDAHMTCADAVTRTIPWTVSTRPLAFQLDPDGPFVKRAGNVRSIVRDDTVEHLGVATDVYEPIQNAQAGDVADALIAEGAQCVETIGALDGGARCFMLLALDKSGFEVRKGDTVLPYFLLRWGHDGQTKLSGKLTNVRVVCHNTLTAAGAAYAFDVRHVPSAKLRLEDAREALAVVRKAQVQTQNQYRVLAAAQINMGMAKDYFQGVFPAPANVNEVSVDKAMVERLNRWNEVQARILACYESGRGAAPGTAWGAYNAVTEYLDHVYPVLASGKVSADRQQSVLFGSYADLRTQAYKEALALA